MGDFEICNQKFLTAQRVVYMHLGHTIANCRSDVNMIPERTPLPKNFPPVVYLPIMERVQNTDDAHIMLRRTREGKIACLAYSALDRLIACCGEAQPWMWTPTVALDALQRSQPFDLLLLDIFIPQSERKF